MPFGERLWLGYGDADYNLGEHIPIEFRAFATDVEPRSLAYWGGSLFLGTADGQVLKAVGGQ